MSRTGSVAWRRPSVLRSWWPLLGILLLSGCLRTSIRSGKAPGAVPTDWQERWHHGFALGLVELHGPVVATRVCPAGWSEINTSVDPMQTVIALGTLGIYTPTTISVVCADARFDDSAER